MKLDRNTCPNEIPHGKYALIHLRKLQIGELGHVRAVCNPELRDGERYSPIARVPAAAISFGMEAREETPFFVLKYSDLFAAAALKAYAEAVEAEAARLHASSDEDHERKALELEEYAAEIRGEAAYALRLGMKTPD